jgi:hypothetical protein
MAKAPQISTKRLAIGKANTQMVGIVAAAAFVTVFCLMASNAVFSQNRYQARVITAKEKAHKQLQANIQTFGQLQTAYQTFDSAGTNVIGGNPAGTGPNDGPNSQIILDALPATYDFPALASSIEKVVSGNGLTIASISGTDDQLNQQNNTSSPSPQPVSIPFSFTVSDASYASLGQLVTKLQQSIRPISVDSMDMSGSVSDMTATIMAHTYFEPAKSVSITKKVIK